MKKISITDKNLKHAGILITSAVKKIKISDLESYLLDNNVRVDQIVSKGNNEFLVRRGFYYTYGQTAENLVKTIKNAIPNIKIVDSGEVWKPFKGGASVANQSHWFVRFKLPDDFSL
ncbi:MAG: hypothetical protein WC934_12600 [Acidithiobacillus sp.]|jgi:hypothetical protein|uniref:hypothetical protein n=1 Tax=Acidithiobacillus sp. TaxID=1872118 RepID=UPI00355DBF48